jgi:hypothetical protein
MTSFKSGLMVASVLGLLLLGACSGGNQTTTSSPEASSTTASAPASGEKPGAMAAVGDHEKEHGAMAGKGMVVESGAYHLELMPEKDAGEIHLDLFVQKGTNHETVSSAKVTAQVQLPDGSQKSLDMKYDAEGKHYTAKLSSAAAGEYKVAVLSDINGEKVNARYSFKQ